MFTAFYLGFVIMTLIVYHCNFNLQVLLMMECNISTGLTGILSQSSLVWSQDRLKGLAWYVIKWCRHEIQDGLF